MTSENKSTNSQAYTLVSDDEGLTILCNQFQQASWVAIDTEFEREKTYYPELCLVQLSDGENVAIIDPLKINDLSPLKQLLYSVSIRKIFHAARQDLEIFYFLWGSLPENIFDTQVAAPLLGYDEQAGYAKLVQNIIGVSLEKAHTRTNWKKRPLSQDQLQYAADDVIYLAKIYPMMLESLKNCGRTHWLDDEFAAFADPALYEIDPGQYLKRVKNARKLNAKKRELLKKLIAWREELAKKENRPRNWILRDEALVDIAGLAPQEYATLSSLKALKPADIEIYSKSILEICQSTNCKPLTSSSKEATPRPLSTDEKVLCDTLSVVVKVIASENNLNPAILAPQKELEKFVRNEKPCSLTNGWRKELLEYPLRQFLLGESSLIINSGKPEIKKIKN